MKALCGDKRILLGSGGMLSAMREHFGRDFKQLNHEFAQWMMSDNPYPPGHPALKQRSPQLSVAAGLSQVPIPA